MMVYRRTEADAPAYGYELELAKKDGIEFHWQTKLIKIGGETSVLALLCSKPDGTEFAIECDMVIKAIGQQKMAAFFTDIAGVDVDEKGRVVVNERMQTSDPTIFAGGDCANGGAEAVDASQMGKHAAMGIHETITGDRVSFAGAAVPSVERTHTPHH